MLVYGREDVIQNYLLEAMELGQTGLVGEEDLAREMRNLREDEGLACPGVAEPENLF